MDATETNSGEPLRPATSAGLRLVGTGTSAGPRT